MITRSPSENRTPYNPEIHHRRSVRLKGYDYSLVGAYFVTICTQNRECVFGKITDGKMEPNDAGRRVARWWAELNHKFPTIQTDESIVMPNHFHGIVIIGYPDPVGAALRGRPPKTGHPHRGAPTLGDIVDWFKTMTTNDYIRGIKQSGWPQFEKRLWQRNYYERVVRDDSEMHRTREYITGNPAGWLEDEENPVRHS
ncbi:MAG: transposase [Nitrospirae bacterium]|nr:transposase [Nitrospirota bacterium]